MSMIGALHAEVAGVSNNEASTEGFASNSLNIGPGTNMTTPARRDFRGNGGNYYFCTDSAIPTDFIEDNWDLERTTKEGFIRVCLARHTAGGKECWVGGVGTSDTTTMAWQVKVTSTGDVEIYTDGTLRATSASSIPADDLLWFVLEIWYRHSSALSSTDGFVYVYKDFDYSSPFVSYDGLVQATAGATSGLDTNQVLVHLSALTGLDDAKAQDISIQYDSGAGGTISVGDVIRVEGSGGALLGKATVTAIIGDDVSGVLQLKAVEDSTATPWDGRFTNSPFSGAATIIQDAGSGWSANATTGNMDNSSGLPGQGYFAAARSPSSLDATNSTPLVFYGGVDNVDCVNDGVGSDSETAYVYGTNPSENDIYSFTAVLPAATDIAEIKSTVLYSRLRQDGIGISQYNVQTKEDTNPIVNEDLEPLPADWTVTRHYFSVNPRTGSSWDHTSLSNTEFGIKFES